MTIIHTPVYVGNCIDSFDEDGDCTNDSLPFSDATEFAQYVDEHGDESFVDNLKITYNSDLDVHEFYIVC